MITSRSNNLIKLCRSLKDKSNRDELNLYIAEGYKTVKEAIKCGKEIDTVVCTESGEALLGKTDKRTEIVSDDVFKSISEEVSPQGVLAVIKKPKITLKSPKGSCIFLDEVKDPSNVGAIIRTAVALGYSEVYLANSADPYNSKSVRASMSGVFKATLYIGDREELLKYIDKPIVIADMNGENVQSCKTEEKICLVIGNEGHGVSDLLKSKASKIVSIPMENGMESLNASVSAGILMYSLKRKGE